MRVFAGPNGSGKTTVKNGLGKPDAWFGVYINPDDMEQTWRGSGFLDLGRFGVATDTATLKNFLAGSALLKREAMTDVTERLKLSEGKLELPGTTINSYHAAVMADFIRRRLIATGQSFTFETVMSSRDKVDLLREAQGQGFRTYLYYIATSDPMINVARVRNRVAGGGHDVPEKKIIDRYHRSLGLLWEAVRYSNRAFFFDTSEETPWYFAEMTDTGTIDAKGDEIPLWFDRAIWNIAP